MEAGDLKSRVREREVFLVTFSLFSIDAFAAFMPYLFFNSDGIETTVRKDFQEIVDIASKNISKNIRCKERFKKTLYKLSKVFVDRSVLFTTRFLMAWLARQTLSRMPL